MWKKKEKKMENFVKYGRLNAIESHQLIRTITKVLPKHCTLMPIMCVCSCFLFLFETERLKSA